MVGVNQVFFVCSFFYSFTPVKITVNKYAIEIPNNNALFDNLYLTGSSVDDK
jgi:hypothetical protein